MLHALQEMLVVSDIEHQRQLWRVGLVCPQRCVVDAVVGAGVLQAVQAGAGGQIDAGCTVKPALALGGDTQRQLGLAIELGAQLGFTLREQFWRVDTLQRAAQCHQLAVELLLVQLNEVRLAGAVEQHARDQRHHRRAGREQQRQATGQGQALDQLTRSSST